MLTRHLSSGLHMLYVNMMRLYCRSCEGGYVIRVLILFYFYIYLIRADVCLSTVQIVLQVKSQRKASGLPHIFDLSLKKCEGV